ncbi:SET domain protein [Polystyrenella longa]|uniref:SET domain protein n=1 Tax=Polystyrenella longa TaxID=2528007 RepID=A0A518CII1_9PLAN|nr:SET domain-containing protein-lysine N-methyltransferase [Polystyrenella longa]QDU79035.1 SET domain protein [Polystyrenella longa]
MSFKQSEWVKVKKVKGKGRGIFARKFIPEGTVIEKVPVLVMQAEDTYGTFIEDYVFEWGKDTVALALGYGSLYNHSYKANCRYEDVGRQSKAYIAERDIEKGEEVTINYNGSPNDKTRMAFDVK